MRRTLAVVSVFVVLASACSADPDQTTNTSSPTNVVGSTVASSTSSTAKPSTVPEYFRFDQSGLYFVDAGGEQQLVSDGVWAASHDGMGGVLYTTVDEAWEGGLHWTRRGTAEPETLNYLRGWAAVLDGHPMLVGQKDFWSDGCPDTTHRVHLVDLRTGDEHVFGCFGGEDGGISVTSGGGTLLVGTSWLAVGANGTDKRIHFYDTTGTEIVHPANPVPESCAPCELDVHLSTDGTRLAYRLRPDAKWSRDLEEQQRIDMLTFDEWWESSKDIPGAVVVVDLASGQQVFSMAVAAGEGIADFDGRRLVLESCELRPTEEHGAEQVCTSRIIGLEGGAPEIVTVGRVRLANEVCCDPPTSDVFPPLLRVWSPSEGQVVDSRRYRFEGVADPDAEIMAAERYPVAVEPQGTWSITLVLRPGLNLATFTATDAAGNATEVRRAVHFQPPLVIRHDGLGVVSFGEPVDSVMAALTELLGPPDWEEIQVSEDIDRSVRWENPFLYLQFTYWDHFGAAPDPPESMPEGPVLHYYLIESNLLATEKGITVGSTVGEVEAAYPDVRFQSDCGSDEMYEFVVDAPAGWPHLPIFGLLDGDVEDAATRIIYIGAGWDRTPC